MSFVHNTMYPSLLLALSILAWSCTWSGTVATTSFPTRSPSSIVPPQQDPIIDYSFSQQGCKDGRWDFDDGLSFTRMLNATSCVHDEEEGFQYWRNGAYNTRVDGEEYMDALSSSEITNQLDTFITRTPGHDIRYTNITFMMWMTRIEPWTSSRTHIMDIGPSEWQTDDETVTLGVYRSNDEGLKLHLEHYWDSLEPDFVYDGVYDAFGGALHSHKTIVFAISISNLMDTTYSRLHTYVLGWNGFNQGISGNCYNCGTGNIRLGPLAYRDSSRIRFNTYRYTSPGTDRGTNGTAIHRVAIWNRVLPEDEVVNEARYGMPRSIAACRNASVEVYQGLDMEFSLNTSNFVRDFDNDTIQVIRIWSLPEKGQLTFNHTVVTQQDLPLILTDDNSVLTYVVDNNLTWSYPNCSGTEFRFDASDDGMNFSLAETYADICIREFNRAPVVTGQLISLPRGSKITFKIIADDYNDRTSPPSFELGLLNASVQGEYRNTSTVSFVTREGDFGGLFLDDCATPIETEDLYHLSTEFCYVSTKTNDVQGLDHFNVTVSDAESSSDPVALWFNNTNPLSATGGTLTLNEYPDEISFSLPLFDGLDRSLELRAQVLVLPQHGKLRFEGNNSLVSIGDLVDSNLTYQPDEYFFSQFASGQYVNFYGEPLPAPDSLVYLVKETSNQTISEPGVVKFNITNVFSDIVSVSGLDKPINMTFGIPYKFGTRIQINDPDNQQHRVGVYLSTIEGEFVCDINQTELKVIGPNQNSLLLSSCGLTMDDGCSELYLAARPRYVNYLLTKMSLKLSQARSSYSRVNMRFYKPGPDGITPGNFESEILYGGPQISAKLELNVNGTDDTKNTGSGDSPFMILIMPALLIVAGFAIICSPCLAVMLLYLCVCGRGYRIICWACNQIKSGCTVARTGCRKCGPKVKADPPDLIQADVKKLTDLAAQFNSTIEHLKTRLSTQTTSNKPVTSTAGAPDIHELEDGYDLENVPLFRRRGRT